MPNLTLVLPHWLYWSGLLLFPLAAMYLVRRQISRKHSTRKHGTRQSLPGAVNLPTAYLFWITAGFVGIHRFYLRNYWGLIYIPLFILVLFCNVQQRAARLDSSNARNEVSSADFLSERAQKALTKGRAGAAEQLEQAREDFRQAQAADEVAAERLDWWDRATAIVAGFIALLLLIDALLLPGMTRRCAEKEAGLPPPAQSELDFEVHEPGTGVDPARRVHTPITNIIDRISGFTGEFVAYWSVLAVFAYYYEVVARYVFNSPTNWVHESMFLMFGMQYLLSGAYALREDAHVRVDVLYLMFSDRIKVWLDVVSSTFFFLFATALLVTGWIFAADAIQVWEVSFTEWAIQYWPVKSSIALGAVLLLLQGLSKLIKDLTILVARET